MSANEITLELLAKTALVFMCLEKYKDIDERELISDAYSFLGDCESLLENRNYSRRHSGGGYTQWAAAVQEITGNKRGSKRLRQFFVERPYWREKIFNDAANVEEGESSRVEEEDLRSLESLKRLCVQTTYIPEIKADFDPWNAQKNSEQGRENRLAKKKIK